MTGPTTGEALRRAAFDNVLTQDQARAVASILATLDVVDGGGSAIPEAQKARLLDAVVTTYRGELLRLTHAEGASSTPKGTAAARRRAEVAARRAAEVEAVEAADNVVSLRPDAGPDDAE